MCTIRYSIVVIRFKISNMIPRFPPMTNKWLAVASHCKPLATSGNEWLGARLYE